ncbi:protein of unknown function [Bradyrhizobium sp. ORS 285]|nr:protein of unknown function [Bradyrhizobium sp. ORS 285]
MILRENSFSISPWSMMEWDYNLSGRRACDKAGRLGLARKYNLPRLPIRPMAFTPGSASADMGRAFRSRISA